MKSGTRALIAVAVAFVVYRIAVAVMPSASGAVVSVILGVLAGSVTWVLTRQKG